MKLYEEAELYFIALNQQIITASTEPAKTDIDNIDSVDSYSSDPT